MTQKSRSSRRVSDPGDVFVALADPTRRHLLDLLADHPRSASDLSRRVDISRQAIAKHLTALEAVSLVSAEKVGREVVFDVSAEGLQSVSDWIEQTSKAWELRLDRIGAALEESS